ncbi:MAG: hypothetical protein ACRDJS_00855 [Actinomycetota bacterium]
MTPRRLAYASLIVALAASGVYVFVYLVRWEWNRALIAGIFFMSAEIALIGAALYEKLRSIERRMASQNSPQQALERIQEAAPDPHNHFAWLTENRGDLNVFVPVLMGAGLVISALAWLVEKVARTTAQPVLERRLAMKMAPLAMPAGGLMGRPSPGVVVRGTSNNQLLKKGLTAFALVLSVYLSIDVLADLTQNRPDAPSLDRSTRLVMTVNTSDSDFYSPVVAARGLWNHCRGTVNQSSRVPGRLVAEAGLVTLVVQPAIGENAQKRLIGCLQDATIDHVSADILSTRSVR